MITFEEWWVMQFLPKEHRYAAEQSWNTCHREMERIANMRVAETIHAQQAEIERLKGQRDRLMQELLWAMGALDSSQFIASMCHFTTVRSLIAEIEANK